MLRRTRIRWLLLTLLSLGFTSSVLAQEIDEPLREGRGYLTVGLASLGLDALNDRLAPVGYPALEESMLTIGGGGHGIRGRWLFGGEGQGLIGRTKDAAIGGRNHQVEPRAGYGLFNVGYLIVKRGDFHVYPLAGLGGGGMAVKITERSSPTFDEALADPRRGTTLATGGLVAQVGLGVERLVVLSRREANGGRQEGGLLLGVRVGYVFMPLRGDWTIDGERAAQGPEVGVNGPYLRFAIGFGGRTWDR